MREEVDEVEDERADPLGGDGVREPAVQLVPAIDPGVLGKVLDTGDLAARVGEGLGTDADSYLQRVKDVPQEVTRIAAKFVDVEPPPHQHVDHQGQGPVRVRISKAAAQRFGDALDKIPAQTPAQHVAQVPARNLEVAQAVRDEVVGLSQAEAPTVSLQTVAALKQLVGRGVEASQAVDLTQRGVHLEVSQRLSPIIEVLSHATGLSAEQAQVFDAGLQLRTAALTNLGVTGPGLEEIVGPIEHEHAGAAS